MFNVCFNCGEYHADKEIDLGGPYAICPECGHRHRFTRLPLFLIGGTSGAGKTTALGRLVGTMPEVVMLEGDILWHPALNKPDDNYRDYHELWLRLSKNLSQSNRPVVIFSAGMGVPENLENCVERRYFSELHYLALVCDEDALEERLLARPDWRHSGEIDFITEQIRFNNWFIENGENFSPKIDLIDTTDSSIVETTEQIARWIRSRL
jgi:DNA-directed RNA polymerase subunit RPC12/RpoP/broad-specificity NMP kinase